MPESLALPPRASGRRRPQLFASSLDVDGAESPGWNTAAAAAAAALRAPWWTAAALWKARGWKRGLTTTWSSPTPTLSERRRGREGDSDLTDVVLALLASTRAFTQDQLPIARSPFPFSVWR